MGQRDPLRKIPQCQKLKDRKQTIENLEFLINLLQWFNCVNLKLSLEPFNRYSLNLMGQNPKF